MTYSSRVSLSVTLVAAALLSPAADAVAGIGDPDPGFGKKGRVVRDLGGADRAVDVVVQRDGKLVTLSNAERANDDDVVVVSRYRPGGAPDRSFGKRGRVTLRTAGDDVGGGLALQPNGRILVGFTNFPSGAPSSFAVGRLRRDGTPDRAFDRNGVQTTGFGVGFGSASGRDVAYAGQGRIVVGGLVDVIDGSRFDSDFAVARFTADGQLDDSFSGDGRQTTDFGDEGDDIVTAVAVDSQYRIVLAGSADPPGTVGDPLALARYSVEGELDGTLSDDGRVISDAAYSASDVAVMPDDRIVVAGDVAGDFLVGRFGANGVPDSTFAGDGFQTVDFVDGADAAYAVALDGSKVVAAGVARTQRRGRDFAVARLRATGELDARFDDGREAVDFRKGEDIAYGVAVDRRGNVVAAGGAERRRVDSAILRLRG